MSMINLDNPPQLGDNVLYQYLVRLVDQINMANNLDELRMVSIESAVGTKSDLKTIKPVPAVRTGKSSTGGAKIRKIGSVVFFTYAAVGLYRVDDFLFQVDDKPSDTVYISFTVGGDAFGQATIDTEGICTIDTISEECSGQLAMEGFYFLS